MRVRCLGGSQGILLWFLLITVVYGWLVSLTISLRCATTTYGRYFSGTATRLPKKEQGSYDKHYYSVNSPKRF